MYFTLEGDELDNHPSLKSQMFKLRAKVFRDELRWVDCEGDEERDVYDDLNPVYIMHTDPTGARLYAAARLMPTVGPTLLADVFGETIPDAVVTAPNVWEITRLAVDDERIVADGRGARRFQILRDMLVAGMEFGVAQGIDTFLANFDPIRLRIWRRLGARFDVIGTSDRHSVPVYLGLIESTTEALEALRERLARPEPLLSHAPSPWPPCRRDAPLSAAA